MRARGTWATWPNRPTIAPRVLFQRSVGSSEARDDFQVVVSALVFLRALVCPVLCMHQRRLCYTPPCLRCACACVAHVTPPRIMLHLSPTACRSEGFPWTGIFRPCVRWVREVGRFRALFTYPRVRMGGGGARGVGIACANRVSWNEQACSSLFDFRISTFQILRFENFKFHSFRISKV